jgi:hypothetical protein
MFQFHGWLVITDADPEDEGLEAIKEREDEYEADLVNKITQDVDDDFCHFDIKHTCNDLRIMMVHGLRNHTYQPVIDLFQSSVLE